MTISERIERQEHSLGDRGIKDDSYFEVEFEDGSTATEHDINWSSISERKIVRFGDKTKAVMLCSHPLKRIKIVAGDINSEILVEKGDSVYQAVMSSVTFVPGKQIEKQLGRVVGIVRDGSVVEERFLDAVAREVQGVRL